ncbi:MAG: VWA domain-containing protein, partial [Proteobacteria bacterium]|nr:VWA domain-containing protein [Pseudomonadota bacterium]
TPTSINFNDIPSGDTASSAAVFKIYGCTDATIRVKVGSEPANPFSILYPLSGSITKSHDLAPYSIARIWLGYTAGTANVAVTDGSVTFECVESGQEFTFIIKANSIIRPRVAVMLALDQSGSMDWEAGTSGLKRLAVLKDAATKFMEIIPVNNGVGLIRFDHDAYPVNDATYPGMNVTRITNAGNRLAAIASVTAHNFNPMGNTSVGDGLKMARDILNAVPATDYEEKALIVFTDGQENRPVSISSVSASINNRTFAIGLGNEAQVNTSALNSLTNGTGGYLKLTGLLSSSIDDYFRVPKYFLQILAGVTNTNIIKDPNGFIAVDQEIRIPFIVNEADLDATVILMVDAQVVDMVIETPNGDIIDPTNVASLGIEYSVGNTSKNYKFSLPVAFPDANHTGQWHAVLKINNVDYKRYVSKLRDQKNDNQSFITHGARYSVIVHSYSNLRMNASIHQNSFEPGANIRLRALLNEYGLPIENRANINVEVARADGSNFTVALSEIEPGIFEQSFVANIPGTYHCRFLANGTTIRGNEFTREQTLTAAVFQGGNRPTTEPVDPEKGGIGKILEKCCKKISWILVGIIFMILIFILLTTMG